jgi:hypothetical protein
MIFFLFFKGKKIKIKHRTPTKVFPPILSCSKEGKISVNDLNGESG